MCHATSTLSRLLCNSELSGSEHRRCMQRGIAEELSKEPEAEAADVSEGDASTSRRGSFAQTLQTRVVEPAGRAWHALAAWLAHVWSVFVNWTVEIGSHVKQLFFSGKGKSA